MHILSAGTEAKYPYSPAQLRADNPQISFPAEMSDAVLAEWGVYPVTPAPQPVADHTKNVTEVLPQQVSGAWTQTWLVADATPDEIADRTAAQAATVRDERNARLASCDWTQLSDAPVNSFAWATYRQALRNVPLQPGFPWEVIWPVQPA